MSTLHPLSDSPKGVVNPAAAQQAFRLERYLPEADLAPFLDFFWLVEWRLPEGVKHVQRTLPHPCVNLVFDRERTAVFGVVTGAFDYTLQGSGKVLGLRFRAGGFRGFLGDKLKTLTDRTMPLAPLFGGDSLADERAVLDAVDDTAMLAAASAVLRRALPPADAQVERIDAILALLRARPDITRAEQLAEQAGLGLRSLQQLFMDYVGVSPKWAIRRNRLQDAADRLAKGDEPDLARLAQALGYFDQAHFTSDFEKLVGKPPADYRRSCQAANNR